MAETTEPAKPEEPKTLGAKIGVALPIALTALATALAGMSNGQLQEAMFWRSFAAQDQAKATNQWTLAGFKRDRSLICHATAVQLRAMSNYAENPFRLYPTGLADPQAYDWLTGHGPETPKLPEIADEDLKRLLADIRGRVPEVELRKQAKSLKLDRINEAIDNAEKGIEKVDKEWEPYLKSAASLVSSAPKENATAAQAAGFDLEQRRYRLEATLNQELSFLYEAQVKHSSARSEVHERKSKNFFIAMLAAQIGATLSALAEARRRKSVLWAVAGVTGIVAIAIGGYVYLSD